MTDDTTITELHQPGTILDPLTEIARDGARQMLAAALKAEAAGFVAQFAEERLPDGRQRVVLHGAGPERTIQTGIGAIPVRRPKVRDRATDAPAEEKIRFSSSILPKWARRSRSLDALLPILYLRGVSTGDFQEALTALLGKDAPNLSPGVISRLTAGWQEDYDRWSRRDLSARRYVYIWADGVYLQARMEPTAECMLVVIGATPEGKKELIGFQVGVRESAQSWRELLVDLKARGLAAARNWPSATARWGSGRRWTRSSRARVTSGVGCTRSPTCSTDSRNRCTPRSPPTCARSPAPRPAPRRWRRSRSSRRNTASNTSAG
jgi:putative transposase